MTERIRELFEEYLSILNLQQYNEADMDYSLLDYHLPMLRQLDVIKGSSISVYDLYKQKHVFLSSSFGSILGWNTEKASAAAGNTYFNERTHPLDLETIMEAGNYFLKFSFQINPENRKDYKFISDYRVMKNDGEYLRVVEQTFALELDRRGNVWLGLSIIDISPDSDILTPARCRVMNIRTGEIFYFPPETEIPLPKPDLTSREKEILQLISQGLISKQIADKLYISVNTVNTHRQRIIEKLNVSNTFEAINYAHRIGLISKT
jgi:DNA-binding CsgD family transcriptional regulator